MSETAKRNDSGQFVQSFDDDRAISVLVSADRPLSTSEVAERMDVPRTTAHDGLRRLEEDYPIRTWLMDGSTRCWDIYGNWGGESVADKYGDEMLTQYLETGEFPTTATYDDVFGAIEEAMIEWGYQSEWFPQWRYDQLSRLAELFGMDAFEFAKLSPDKIYALLHEGKMDETVIECLDNHEVFRRKREEAGITQKTVAERAGVSQPKLSQWETRGREIGGFSSTLVIEALEQLLEEKSNE